MPFPGFTGSQSTTSPVPSSYKFQTENIPGNTQFVNFPQFLGGGQYANAPGSGELIQSYRGPSGQEPGDIPQYIKEYVRRGLPGSTLEVDHIFENSIGGTYNTENLIAMKPEDHAKKTAVGAIARTLLDAGEIQRGEAMVMIQNWENKDVSDVATNFGSLANDNPVEFAKAKVMEWSKPVDISFTDVLKGFRGLLPKWLGGKEPTDPGARMWEAAMEEGSPNVVSQFARGIQSGLSMGYWEDKPLPNATTGQKVARAAGDITGTIVSFMALSAATAGIGGFLGIGARFAASAPKIATGAKAVATATTKTGTWAKIASGLSDGLLKTAQKTYLANTKYNKLSFSGTKVVKALDSAGLFVLHGQLSKQEENTFQSRVKGAFFDASMGAMLGVAGGSAKAYAGIGAGTYALSIMENPEDISGAVINSAVMVGLHGIGRVTKNTASLLALNKQRALDVYKKNGVDLPPDPPSGSGPTKTYTKEELADYNKKAVDSIIKKAATPEDAMAKTKQVITASRELYKSGLDAKERAKADAEDYQSVLNKTAETTRAELELIPARAYEIAEGTGLLGKNPPRFSFPDNYGRVIGTNKNVRPNEIITTGVASSLEDGAYRQMMDYFAVGGGKLGDPIIFVPRKEKFKSFMETKNELLPEGEKYENTQWNVQALAIKDGNLYRAGFTPDIGRIDTKPFNINETMRRYDLPEMSKMQNKDTMGSALEKLEMDFLVGEVVKSGVSVKGEPWVRVLVTADHWENSRTLNEQYKSKVKTEPATEFAPDVKKSERASIQMLDKLGRENIDNNFYMTIRAMEEEFGGGVSRLSATLDGMVDSNVKAHVEKALKQRGERLAVRDVFDFFERANRSGALNEKGFRIYEVLLGEGSYWSTLSEAEKVFVKNLQLFKKTGQIEQKIELKKAPEEVRAEQSKTILEKLIPKVKETAGEVPTKPASINGMMYFST